MIAGCLSHMHWNYPMKITPYKILGKYIWIKWIDSVKQMKTFFLCYKWIFYPKVTFNEHWQGHQLIVWHHAYDNLGTIDILSQIIPQCGGCPMHGSMFSSVPGPPHYLSVAWVGSVFILVSDLIIRLSVLLDCLGKNSEPRDGGRIVSTNIPCFPESKTYPDNQL